MKYLSISNYSTNNEFMPNFFFVKEFICNNEIKLSKNGLYCIYIFTCNINSIHYWIIIHFFNIGLNFCQLEATMKPNHKVH